MARCIKSSKELSNMQAYILEREEQLPDLNGVGLIFRHKKSKARVCVISNEDDNKVFSIGFRTPPKDSTGVAHIIEHTVLCGSKNFPVKDPFIELAKGSLNTFLNAMTYSDKTLYPVASCNEKDFQNLIHVYLDAVFYPNIYKHKEIFEQEGWHYELENKEAELKLNGIVYSEMKGVFSSPEQQLYRQVQASLYPDTPYGVESGGDPDYIPELSYEEYLDFHRTYYSPANSYIYLYGNLDIEEKLNWMDENYLSHFDEVKVDSKIPEQKSFDGPKTMTSYYALADNESEGNATYLTYNAVCGSCLDVKECLAMEVLEAALLSSPGAVLKQALIEAGIGQDILSSYDNGILQPNINITAKNANEEQLSQFKEIIISTLKEVVANKVNEKSLLAAINVLEFRYREADFGQFPKGLLYGITIMGSWLYDDDKPFIYLHGNEIFKQLKAEIGTGYFEGLIEKYLIDNNHATYLLLKPQKGLTAKKESELKEKLAAYKESLTDEEKEAIAADTKKLLEYQEAETPEEELLKIPLLKREDISKEVEPLYNTLFYHEHIPVVHHEVFTNGIAYVKCYFDLSRVPKEWVSYLNLFTTVLGYIDTAKHSFSELANEMNIHTGGMNVSMNVFNKRLAPDTYYATMFLGAKVLYEKLPTAVELMQEIILDSKLDDTKRINEIIKESRSRLRMKLNSSGDQAAVDRASSYDTQSGYFADATKGIRYYQFLSDLEENFEAKKEEITNVFKKLKTLIFDPSYCMISITAEKEGVEIIKEPMMKLLKSLPHSMPQSDRKIEDIICSANYQFELKKEKEGLTYSGQVQYVALAGNYVRAGFTTNGALKVLKTIMSYDYLWNNVRVKGGAYGCMCLLGGLDGSAYFVSYRDPNLCETLKVYEGAAEYVRNFHVTERDMTKYIIGTISAVDTPLTPMMKGARSLTAFMGGVTIEDIKRDREQILSATEVEIRKQADLIAAIVAQNNLCVIGNEQKVEANRALFTEVKALF